MKMIEFAIQMEDEGEKYYQDQAALNQNIPLGRVFEKLAEAEGRHAALLRNRVGGAQYTLFDDPLLSESKIIFAGMKAYSHEIFAQPGQLEAYRLAVDLEQRSVDLYLAMKEDAKSPADRELLDWLIRQEKDHLALFDQLEVMLNRPVEWVEAAEFGQREEY